MEKVTLGKKYKDVVLDIEGICVSYSSFLTGCDRVNLQYKSKDGDIKSHHVDVTCCEEVKSFKKIKLPKQETEEGPKPGGPGDIIPKPSIG